MVTYNKIDDIATKIDVSLCDACGALRMREIDQNEEEPSKQPGEVTAVLISQVRRDIGNLAGEVRRGFDALESRVRELELKDAKSEGAVAGIKGTMAFIAAVSTLLGGLIGWLISLVTRSTK